MVESFWTTDSTRFYVIFGCLKPIPWIDLSLVWVIWFNTSTAWCTYLHDMLCDTTIITCWCKPQWNFDYMKATLYATCLAHVCECVLLVEINQLKTCFTESMSFQKHYGTHSHMTSLTGAGHRPLLFKYNRVDQYADEPTAEILKTGDLQIFSSTLAAVILRFDFFFSLAHHITNNQAGWDVVMACRVRCCFTSNMLPFNSSVPWETMSSSIAFCLPAIHRQDALLASHGEWSMRRYIALYTYTPRLMPCQKHPCCMFPATHVVRHVNMLSCIKNLNYLN